VRVLAKGPEETVKAGQRLGRALRAGQTVCLFGDLGAGKTTFIKGIAEALGISRREITSASFVIVAEHGSSPPLYHIDLYRLRDEADLEAAGVLDFIGGEGIAVVEWAEKMDLSGVDAVKVTINFVSGDEREIIIEGIGDEDWNNPEERAA
jgi:tRNA threonylcarbamoyladenosine biosynthesis protein TsaE